MTVKELYEYAAERNAENLELCLDGPSVADALSHSEGKIIEDIDVKAYGDSVVLGVSVLTAEQRWIRGKSMSNIRRHSDCKYRSEIGNCLTVGGFCTAVPTSVCEAERSKSMSSGYVGVDKDYFVSVKEVLNITAETGAWETQTRVRKLPPADVVRVRHGHWINDIGYAGWTCSECGDHEGNKTDKYCHNCGAKMEEK